MATATRRFAAGVNFYGGMGIFGYLGTSAIDRAAEAEQAAGLYGNHAPLLMVGGSEDTIYDEPDDPADDQAPGHAPTRVADGFRTSRIPFVTDCR